MCSPGSHAVKQLRSVNAAPLWYYHTLQVLKSFFFYPQSHLLNPNIDAAHSKWRLIISDQIITIDKNRRILFSSNKDYPELAGQHLWDNVFSSVQNVCKFKKSEQNGRSRQMKLPQFAKVGCLKETVLFFWAIPHFPIIAWYKIAYRSSQSEHK